MSDDKETGNNKPASGAKKTLTLKKTLTAGAGAAARANAMSSRGPKTVVVERRKRRIVTPITSNERKEPVTQDPGIKAKKPEKPAEKVTQQPVGGLTQEEAVARERVLQASRAQAVERQKQVEEEQERHAQMEQDALEAQRLAKEKSEQEDEQSKQSKQSKQVKSASQSEELEVKEAKSEKARPKSDPKKEDEQPIIPQDLPPIKEARPSQKLVSDRELDEAKRRNAPKPGDNRARGDNSRRRSKLTIATALNDDGEVDKAPSLAAMRRRRERQKQKAEEGPKVKTSREVVIPEAISVQELANRMAERGVDVIKLLMKQGQMAKITDILDPDTAQLIAEEMGHTVKRVAESDVLEGLFGDQDIDEDMTPRAPIVTIMGHVDHGKTSLLDAIREANVVSGESGGITQHIGAYQVEKNGQKITFIDTPGHAAFTSMRARGAKSTDIVILVVAADDSVMPQTIEAISHAKAAEVPIIVAINKMDVEGADPNRVRTELLNHEIIVESMGGEILDVEISALKKMNLDGILEAILLQSEILELKANPNRKAEGVVIEAKLDKGRGPVASVIIQRGTLSVGDIVVAGSAWAKVRALITDTGQQIPEAGPAMPIEILGFNIAPEAGDQFGVVENEARAREITEYRERTRRKSLGVGTVTSLEQMMTQLKTSEMQKFPVLIKADVHGSVEAIVGALNNLGNDEVKTEVILGSVGGITESDVTLAKASGAVILGFNVRANKQSKIAADVENIEIRYYNVIYDLIDDMKAAMSGLLSPEMRETFIGNAEILQVFNVSKVGRVAGCLITEGSVERGVGVRLIRDDVVIHEGKLSTLKRFKDEVKEVQSGQECGMAFEAYQDIKPGDVIECYRIEEIQRSL